MRAANEMTARDIHHGTAATFEVERVRQDFPVLRQQVHGKPLIYLDNAATSQKPKVVIDTINRFYSAENSNVHRGVHFLSEQATQAYEETRAQVKSFLHAAETREIIFVRDLPKTRNAKVMRRVARAAFLGEPTGDLSSLENPTAVEEIRNVRSRSAGD